MTPMN